MKTLLGICGLTTIVVMTGFASAQTAPESGTATGPVEASRGAYRFAAGDVIEIRFFQNPELNEQVQVRPDGRISVPGAGELTIEGLTVAEVVSRLGATYANILKSPLITVQVRSFANNRIFVGGEVARPGLQTLAGEQTALGAITEAGGLKASAKRSEVIVIRRGSDDLPQLMKLSMKTRGTEPPEVASFALHPLDVVLVPESGIARANRGVDQYVRQMIPAVLSAGFTYLFNGTVLSAK